MITALSLALAISVADLTKGTPVSESEIESCAIPAAEERLLDPDLFMAIIMVGELGNLGMVNVNDNGSFDLGPAQVNTIQWTNDWFAAKYPSWEAVAGDLCTNIEAAADILARHRDNLSPGQSIWIAVGNYHSKTKELKHAYLARVMDGYLRRVEVSGRGFSPHSWTNHHIQPRR